MRLYQMKMTTLKEAIATGKLEEFIKEHAEDGSGDADKLDRTIASMVDKSKATPATFSQDDSES